MPLLIGYQETFFGYYLAISDVNAKTITNGINVGVTSNDDEGIVG